MPKHRTILRLIFGRKFFDLYLHSYDISLIWEYSRIHSGIRKKEGKKERKLATSLRGIQKRSMPRATSPPFFLHLSPCLPYKKRRGFSLLFLFRVLHPLFNCRRSPPRVRLSTRLHRFRKSCDALGFRPSPPSRVLVKGCDLLSQYRILIARLKIFVRCLFIYFKEKKM